MGKRHDILRSGAHVAALGAGLLLAGCEDHPLHDLGYTTQPSSAEPSEEDPGPPVAQHVSELAGVWLGEAEDPFALSSDAELDPPLYRLPSGSTHIWLRIETPGGEQEATITFGDADPPAPATDPNVGYPVGAPSTVLVADGSVRPPIEGFPYSMYRVYASRDAELAGAGEPGTLLEIFDGKLIDGKLDLSYMPAEAFGSWCALQTSETCDYTGYGNDGAGSCYGGENPEPMNCDRVTLCASEVCTCEAGFGCWSSINSPTTLVLRLSEDGLVGLFQGAVFVNERGFQQPLGTVHFRRVEPSETP